MYSAHGQTHSHPLLTSQRSFQKARGESLQLCSSFLLVLNGQREGVAEATEILLHLLILSAQKVLSKMDSRWVGHTPLKELEQVELHHKEFILGVDVRVLPTLCHDLQLLHTHCVVLVLLKLCWEYIVK